MNTPAIYGLVLTGGTSRRMHSDKAALLYAGQPQLERAVSLLQSQCSKVFVSVRGDQQHDALRSRWPMIVDQHADLGPLAGIAAAQSSHPQVAWLVIACDLPQLTQQAIHYLLQQRDPSYPATAYRNPEDQQPEPLCAIWEPSSAMLIRDAIAAGEFSPRLLLQRWHTCLVDALTPDTLNNVNTPEHYAAINSANTDAAMSLSLHIQYFALFREQAGQRNEAITTTANTPALLYAELQQRHGFKLLPTQLKVAVNNEFCDWQQTLKSGDNVAFIPPVAGG